MDNLERTENLTTNLRATVNFATNGTQTVFSFNFDYLRASFIKVKLEGVTAYIYGQDYIVSERQLEFTTPPPAGKTLTIYRQTPTDRLVAFAEGSVLRATDLSINQIQTIHVLEETLDTIYQTSMTQNSDGDWDGQGKRIVNVKDPLNEQDVVTYQFLKAYASFGDTGLDPEVIKKLLSGVGENRDNIVLLEKALSTVESSIPTKISELENDNFTVKDKNYVHTDNNYTDQHLEKLEGIKEVQKIEFSDITPQWSETGDPYVLTIPLTTKNTFIALYRLVAGKYELDTATTCKVNEVSVTITAPTKFTGYILVTGSVAYGSLEELLAIILNEEADHTYTLEEILGVPYKEPVYPNVEQLAAATQTIRDTLTTAQTSIQTAIVAQQQAATQCREFYELLYDMFGGAVNLSSYADILTVEALTTELRENYVLATTLQNYTLAEVTTALAARVTALENAL